jgi:hypothetical protein
VRHTIVIMTRQRTQPIVSRVGFHFKQDKERNETNKQTITLILGLSMLAGAQTVTTQTDCTVNGNTAHCTSTDNSAQVEQQRQAYQTGQSIGNGIGTGMARMITNRKVNKYCKKNPGATYELRDARGNVLQSGVCPR